MKKNVGLYGPERANQINPVPVEGRSDGVEKRLRRQYRELR